MILFSDFDDTLYIWDRPDQFAQNLAAIQRFRKTGNQFCLATGRSLRSVAKKFPDYAEYCDYLILDNGGICVDAASKVIFTHTIPLDNVREMTNVLRDLDKDIIPVYYYDFGMHQSLEKPPTKIRYWVKDNSLAAKLTTEIKQRYAFCTYTYQNMRSEISWLVQECQDDYIAYSEVMSDKAGKETAIAELASITNFPSSEIVTVGDDWNDLEMIQKFDGYIIAGSKPEVLLHIKPAHVVSSVAKLLERFV